MKYEPIGPWAKRWGTKLAKLEWDRRAQEGLPRPVEWPGFLSYPLPRGHYKDPLTDVLKAATKKAWSELVRMS